MKDYLPGGKKYLGGVNPNPRQGMGIPQWLHEWESKWNRVTHEGDKHGEQLRDRTNRLQHD